jgi:hypothetical protein
VHVAMPMFLPLIVMDNDPVLARFLAFHDGRATTSYVTISVNDAAFPSITTDAVRVVPSLTVTAHSSAVSVNQTLSSHDDNPTRAS